MLDTAGETRTNSEVTFFYGALLMNVFNVGQPVRIYLLQLWVDTRYSLEKLPRARDKRGRWIERERERKSE